MKTTFLFQVNLLLPASVFFDVIKKLLHSSSSTVRRKAMELLNSKLSQYAGSISDDQVYILPLKFWVPITSKSSGSSIKRQKGWAVVRLLAS